MKNHIKINLTHCTSSFSPRKGGRRNIPSTGDYPRSKYNSHDEFNNKEFNPNKDTKLHAINRLKTLYHTNNEKSLPTISNDKGTSPNSLKYGKGIGNHNMDDMAEFYNNINNNKEEVKQIINTINTNMNNSFTSVFWNFWFKKLST